MKSSTGTTLDLLRSAQLTPLPGDPLGKSYTQSSSATTGLTFYDLEAPAKTLYPVLTPLRNAIPRQGGGAGTQANWRAVTGINTGLVNGGISERNRGGIIAHTVNEYFAAYRGVGLEDYVTFEADYAGKGFDDVRMRAIEGLLRSLMIQEENIILGGNTSVALGTTGTPTLTPSTSGGTLGTLTLSVICVALGYDAYNALGGLNNGTTGGTLNIASAVVPGLITRNNAGGTSDSFGGGSAQKSAAASTPVVGNTGSVAAVVVPTRGACAYAWFWGLAGSEVLGAVTNINSVSITANAVGTQTAASLPNSDNSTNSLEFDGILAQIFKSGSGAYYKALPTGVAGTGTGLTSDGAAGINEINTAFNAFWQLYRLSPTTIYVNSQELLNISSKVIANSGSPLYRVNLEANGANNIDSGTVVRSFLNKITNELVAVKIHPTIPPGTMMFYSERIPYSLSNVSNVLQIRTRQDYYQIEWPRTQRSYDYGIYLDEVLQCYFPPAFGMITNIANV